MSVAATVEQTFVSCMVGKLSLYLKSLGFTCSLNRVLLCTLTINHYIMNGLLGDFVIMMVECSVLGNCHGFLPLFVWFRFDLKRKACYIRGTKKMKGLASVGGWLFSVSGTTFVKVEALCTVVMMCLSGLLLHFHTVAIAKVLGLFRFSSHLSDTKLK